MASLILHQIIGEKYCCLNNISNKPKFLEGNIAPDILPNKDERHYKAPAENMFSYLDAAKDRVNLTSFCKASTIDTDYKLGYFLHLVTDYIFYNLLIIDNTKFKQFCNAPYNESSALMYKEYDRVAYYLLQQYPQTDISKLPPKATNTLNENLQILNEKDLIKFIDTCSNINLTELYKQVLNNDYSSLLKIKF